MEEGEPEEAPRTVEVDGMELHLDPELDADSEIRTALPPRLESWRRRSAAGAILTGIGLGLREALEPKRDEPAILVVTSGDPPTDLAVEAELSGIAPSAHVVRIRPWLLDKAAMVEAAPAESAVPAASSASPATTPPAEPPSATTLPAGPPTPPAEPPSATTLSATTPPAGPPSAKAGPDSGADAGDAS